MELKGDITSLCFVLGETKAKCTILSAFNSFYLHLPSFISLIEIIPPLQIYKR